MAAKTRSRTEYLESVPVIPNQVSIFARQPQLASTALDQRYEPIGTYARCIALVEDCEPDAIELSHTIECRDPDIPVIALDDPSHAVLRQSIVGRPLRRSVLDLGASVHSNEQQAYDI
jgi:hypothetical protein